jgi:hypothetical protein
MTDCLWWHCAKQERITRWHCIFRAIRVFSWNGKSTSGGGQVC